MMNHERREIIWFLLGEKYERLRVSKQCIYDDVPLLRVPKIEEFSREESEAAAFLEALNSSDDEELIDHLDELRKRRNAEKEARHRFNNPPALATVETCLYWCKAAYWTLDEVTALFIERSPEVLTEISAKADDGQSKTGIQFLQLRELIRREFFSGLKIPRVKPEVYFDWAEANNIPIPEVLKSCALESRIGGTNIKAAYDEALNKIAELQALADERAAQLAHAISAAAEQPIGTRERESLLKMIVGMAIKKYHYRPEMTKNSATANIATSLQDVGIPLHEDTIRKYLSEAKDLLPGSITK